MLGGCRMSQPQALSSEPTITSDYVTASPRRWRTPTSIGLVVVGTLFLLLLNGQTFTNSIIFLVCWTASLVIRVTDPTLRAKRGVHLVWPLLIVLLHVVFITMVAMQLPSNYVFQKRFNRLDKYLPSVNNGNGSYRFSEEQLKG